MSIGLTDHQKEVMSHQDQQRYAEEDPALMASSDALHKAANQAAQTDTDATTGEGELTKYAPGDILVSTGDMTVGSSALKDENDMMTVSGSEQPRYNRIWLYGQPHGANVTYTAATRTAIGDTYLSNDPKFDGNVSRVRGANALTITRMLPSGEEVKTRMNGRNAEKATTILQNRAARVIRQAIDRTAHSDA